MKKIWLLLAALCLVVVNTQANIIQHDIKVIPTTSEDLRAHIFFNAVRFLSRIKSCTGTANEKFTQFQDTWAKQNSLGEVSLGGKLSTQDALDITLFYYHFTAGMGKDFSAELGTVKAEINQAAPVLIIDSLTEFKTSAPQVKSEPIAVILRLNNAVDDQPESAIALGLLREGKDIHVGFMNPTKPIDESIKSDISTALQKSNTIVDATYKTRDAKETKKIEAAKAKYETYSNDMKALKPEELKGNTLLFEILSGDYTNYSCEKAFDLLCYVIDKLHNHYPDDCLATLKSKGPGGAFKGDTLLGWLFKRFAQKLQHDTSDETKPCLGLIFKLLEVAPELLLEADDLGQSPFDTALLYFKGDYLMMIVKIAIKYKDKLQFTLVDATASARRTFTLNQTPLQFFLLSLLRAPFNIINLNGTAYDLVEDNKTNKHLFNNKCVFYQDVEAGCDKVLISRKLDDTNLTQLIEKLAYLSPMETLSDEGNVYEIDKDETSNYVGQKGRVSCVDYIAFLLNAYNFDVTKPIVQAIRNLIASGFLQDNSLQTAKEGYWCNKFLADSSFTANWKNFFSNSGFKVGLNNNGSTCYQNATLQAINKCDPLYGLLKNRYDAGDKGVNAIVDSFFDTQEALKAFKPSTHDPLPFCLSIQKAYPDFTIATQEQDAQEFLARLMGVLEDYNIIPRASQLDDGFHGIGFQESVSCESCSKSYSMPEHLNGFSYLLNLQIPAGEPATKNLDELLADYVKKENLDDTEKRICRFCYKKSIATKEARFVINENQNFLVVQINRFAADGVTKFVTPIICDSPLTIKDSNNVEHQFEVASVVIHSGGTIAGGHYYTITPHGVYNDTSANLDGGAAIQTLLTTGVHGSGQGYLYFLKRVATAAAEVVIGAGEVKPAIAKPAPAAVPELGEFLDEADYLTLAKVNDFYNKTAPIMIAIIADNPDNKELPRRLRGFKDFYDNSKKKKKNKDVEAEVKKMKNSFNGFKVALKATS